MPVTIRGKKYYRTKEALQIIGISRSTLLRWLAKGILEDASHRDVRGWRLFTESDIKRIDKTFNIVNINRPVSVG